MGKKKNDHINNYSEQIKSLREERERIERELKAVSVKCSHTNSEGKLTINFVDNEKVRCKKCGCEFRFNTISTEKLDNAIDTLHDVINQIKSFSDDPVREKKVIKSLGDIDFNLDEIRELYCRTTKEFSKNGHKHKKKKKDESIGSYGMNSISFINGRKKYN